PPPHLCLGVSNLALLLLGCGRWGGSGVLPQCRYSASELVLKPASLWRGIGHKFVRQRVQVRGGQEGVVEPPNGPDRQRLLDVVGVVPGMDRSEERRVGKECRDRCWSSHWNKKKT